MKTIIVLAMHGAPPKDFPRRDLGEFFSLQNRLQREEGAALDGLRDRHHALEAQLRSWPRTADNDPYHAAAYALAAQMQALSGHEVEVGFNEFCYPTLDEAIEKAALRQPEKVVVVTAMMTRGGGHSEIEIPAAVELARRHHPGVHIAYAWPFETTEIASFLTQQIQRFLEKDGYREGR